VSANGYANVNNACPVLEGIAAASSLRSEAVGEVVEKSEYGFLSVLGENNRQAVQLHGNRRWVGKIRHLVILLIE